MTIGQRIAQLRRERGMSQEELGEAMGVSRQAISKWESDAALPEVDKLIALSRLFAIPVGQLLGVEEPPADGGEDGGAEDPDQRAARLAEEVLRRYVEAQYSPPVRPARRRWLPYAAGAAAVLLAALWAGDVVTGFQNQIRSLQMQTDEIQSSQIEVNNQVSSITQRVEESLASQASLLVNGTLTMEELDLTAGTATVGAAVTPKALGEGRTLELVVSGEGVSLREPMALGADGVSFSAAVTVPLVDGLRYYVAFTGPEGQETEELEPNGAFSYLAENTALEFDAEVASGGFYYDREYGQAVLKDFEAYLHYYAVPLWNEETPVRLTGCRAVLYLDGEPAETFPLELMEGSDEWIAAYLLHIGEYALSCPEDAPLWMDLVAEDEFGRTAARTVWDNLGGDRVLWG